MYLKDTLNLRKINTPKKRPVIGRVKNVVAKGEQKKLKGLEYSSARQIDSGALTHSMGPTPS